LDIDSYVRFAMLSIRAHSSRISRMSPPPREAFCSSYSRNDLATRLAAREGGPDNRFMAFEPRTYRRTVDPGGLATFEVVELETDVHIAAQRDLSGEAAGLVREARADLEAYIARHPRFRESFVPVAVEDDAPAIVRAMAAAADAAAVGPMAAVAGALAEFVGAGLSSQSREVIVENGGDVWLGGGTERVVAVHAGSSPLSGRVGILVPAELMPCAVCTSSATVGPSVSLGRADAACVVATSGALADAVASALGNRVHSPEDIERAMAAVRDIPGVLGLAVVIGESLGAWGRARLVPIQV
jgi:ApbE superfamily uncharacterized protein (UPF0280 family)